MLGIKVSNSDYQRLTKKHTKLNCANTKKDGLNIKKMTLAMIYPKEKNNTLVRLQNFNV